MQSKKVAVTSEGKSIGCVNLDIPENILEAVEVYGYEKVFEFLTFGNPSEEYQIAVAELLQTVIDRR